MIDIPETISQNAPVRNDLQKNVIINTIVNDSSFELGLPQDLANWLCKLFVCNSTIEVCILMK